MFIREERGLKVENHGIHCQVNHGGESGEGLLFIGLGLKGNREWEENIGLMEKKLLGK